MSHLVPATLLLMFQIVLASCVFITAFFYRLVKLIPFTISTGFKQAPTLNKHRTFENNSFFLTIWPEITEINNNDNQYWFGS